MFGNIIEECHGRQRNDTSRGGARPSPRGDGDCIPQAALLRAGLGRPPCLHQGSERHREDDDDAPVPQGASRGAEQGVLRLARQPLVHQPQPARGRRVVFIYFSLSLNEFFTKSLNELLIQFNLIKLTALGIFLYN